MSLVIAKSKEEKYLSPVLHKNSPKQGILKSSPLNIRKVAKISWSAPQCWTRICRPAITMNDVDCRLYSMNCITISILNSEYYIGYRVMGLYRLGKTCYLHTLLCNNSIIAQFPVQNDIISICTWENDNTANSHATSNTWLVTCHCLRINCVTRTPHDKTIVGVLTRQHAAQR